MFARVYGQKGRIVEAPFANDPNTNYEENVFHQVLRGHGTVFSISDELMNCEKTDDLGQVTDQYKLKQNILREFPDVITDSEYMAQNSPKIQGEPVLGQGIKGRIIKSEAELKALKARGLVIDTGKEELAEIPEAPVTQTVTDETPVEAVKPVEEAPVVEDTTDETGKQKTVSDINIDMTKQEIISVATANGIELVTAERELPKVKLIQVINEKATAKK